MLLHTALTPNGRKPLLMFEELGISPDIHWVDFSRGEQRTPEYLALNPNNKIPTLEDDGVVVWESGAILLYLAEKFGRFLPTDPRGRQATISQVFFQVGGIGPAGGRAGGELRKPPEARNPDLPLWIAEVDRLLGVQDRVLGDGRPYLAGDAYTIADMMHFFWTDAVFAQAAEGIGEHPLTRAWVARLRERPAVAKVLALTR
jgi:GST-like protein